MYIYVCVINNMHIYDLKILKICLKLRKGMFSHWAIYRLKIFILVHTKTMSNLVLIPNPSFDLDCILSIFLKNKFFMHNTQPYGRKDAGEHAQLENFL